MRSFTKRSIAAALAAATIATSIPLMPASAATQTPAAVTAKSNAVSSDFSARRYYRHGYRGYHRGGGAAAFGAFAAVAGTIGAIAAAQDRRDYYNNYGYGYYGYGRPYYGRHYYRRW